MDDIEPIKANEPVEGYSRITFSTVETQWDIQLQQAMCMNPTERLKNMQLLNEIAFGKITKKKKSNRIIFTRYESFL